MKTPTLGNPQNTIEVLQKYNFNFQKKFGQNFLIDEHVLDKIIRAAEITKDDYVLEIGPGIGTMFRTSNIMYLFFRHKKHARHILHHGKPDFFIAHYIHHIFLQLFIPFHPQIATHHRFYLQIKNPSQWQPAVCETHRHTPVLQPLLL